MTKEERERQRQERLKQEEAARRAAKGTTRAKTPAKTSSSKEGPTADDFELALKSLNSDEWAGGNTEQIIAERARKIAKARIAASTPEKDPKALKDELIKKLNSLGRKGLTATTQANIATALGMSTYTADYDGFLADVTAALRSPEAVGAESIEAALAALPR